MSIADIKTGGWAVGERLTSTQMGSVRAELLKCVDGVGGGTYTPSATVSISDLTVGGTNRLKYGSRNVTKALRCAAVAIGADWAFNSGSTILRWEQGALAGTPLVLQCEDMPLSGTLTSISIFVRGQPVSRANLSFNLPRFYLNKRNVLSETVTAIVASQVDASATVPAYEAVHAITASGLTEALGSGNEYFLGVTGESGGGEDTVGLRYLGAQAIVTFTEQGEW